MLRCMRASLHGTGPIVDVVDVGYYVTGYWPEWRERFVCNPW